MKLLISVQTKKSCIMQKFYCVMQDFAYRSIFTLLLTSYRLVLRAFGGPKISDHRMPLTTCCGLI